MQASITSTEAGVTIVPKKKTRVTIFTEKWQGQHINVDVSIVFRRKNNMHVKYRV
jgi:hypothetical protein